MVELGELEKQHQDFASRGIRIVAISNDTLQTAKKTQADFPHLLIAADTDQKMAQTFEVIHEKMAPDGKDTNAPTSILIDRDATVRWLYRPRYFFERLAPGELLAGVSETLVTKRRY